MAAFGINAICPSTSVNDFHTLGYETARTSGRIFALTSDDSATYRLWADALGDVVVGPFSASALATTATDGFLYIQSMNGVPTGTPAQDGTGRVPLTYDYANDKLYVYNTAWVGVTLS